MDAGVREPIVAGVLEALERGAVVVTGNQRAARSLRRGFDRRNRGLGLKSWRPAAILAWDSWTAGLWRGMVLEGKAGELLLNRTQEHAVWRGILEADEELRSLRTVDSLAEMAADAWGRLCRFGGEGRLRGWAGLSRDTRSFQRWAREFERRCAREGLLAAAQLEWRLGMAVRAGEVLVAKEGLALVGFDGMTPAQAGLLEALSEAGVRVEELGIGVKAERRLLVEAADERGELETAAAWVREFLEAHEGARVGVIVPGLEARRAEIDRVFREVLAPELEDITAEEDGAPYEFSLGVRLAEMPMVAVALDLLRWVGGALPLGRVSGLLVSRYFGGEGEGRARAEFDGFELRKMRMLRPEISLDRMALAVAGSRRKAELVGLLEALRRMLGVVERRFGREEMRLHAEWSDAVRGLLSAAGWGAGRGEDSYEFQLWRKWESALDELATLDFSGVRVRFGEALAGLERIARETLFAPESREAPVQVMGPLEAAGERFDAVWFLGAGDLSWPVRMGASPLLPWPLQKDLGMPGTDAARDGELARVITERIAASAEVVVFSYGVVSGEARQRASTVLDGLEIERLGIVELGLSDRAREVVALDAVADVEPIDVPKDEVMRGGVRILQLQAACGFRAFAEIRLGAKELGETELGMDAAERGSVVHKVLEVFWDEVKTQAALKSMGDAEREEMLSWAINEGLRKVQGMSSAEWDSEYVNVQRERLHILLRPWLELEMQRRPFAVKLSEKEFKDKTVGPLRLTVRVDRVDVSEDGGQVIIDYKTGAASSKDWLTDRPDAPQVPLYAILTGGTELEGVAFAQIRAGKGMGLHGFATKKETLAKVAKLPNGVASLEAQVEDWQRVLTKLAEDFYRGDTRVRPKNYPKTCEYCEQRLICRLDAAEFEDDGEDEDGEAMSD